ncbi:hypothetical protein PoB_003343300 [Plakobranchus ocellatus]|uniref:Uncharacterized protein n=1 Tax=Plakobranchus ocellatus TaxID=259542 RepID=A0AAV4AK83_9GAST|nr:hypothetical protein PoB_003343300 [Plakobranchus ocellatus]
MKFVRTEIRSLLLAPPQGRGDDIENNKFIRLEAVMIVPTHYTARRAANSRVCVGRPVTRSDHSVTLTDFITTSKSCSARWSKILMS